MKTPRTLKKKKKKSMKTPPQNQPKKLKTRHLTKTSKDMAK